MSESDAKIHELEQENKRLQVEIRDLKRLLADAKKPRGGKAFSIPLA